MLVRLLAWLFDSSLRAALLFCCLLARYVATRCLMCVLVCFFVRTLVRLCVCSLVCLFVSFLRFCMYVFLSLVLYQVLCLIACLYFSFVCFVVFMFLSFSGCVVTCCSFIICMSSSPICKVLV